MIPPGMDLGMAFDVRASFLWWNFSFSFSFSRRTLFNDDALRPATMISYDTTKLCIYDVYESNMPHLRSFNSKFPSVLNMNPLQNIRLAFYCSDIATQGNTKILVF
jgi:hypothetical protein